MGKSKRLLAGLVLAGAAFAAQADYTYIVRDDSRNESYPKESAVVELTTGRVGRGSAADALDARIFDSLAARGIGIDPTKTIGFMLFFR